MKDSCNDSCRDSHFGLTSFQLVCPGVGIFKHFWDSRWPGECDRKILIVTSP